MENPQYSPELDEFDHVDDFIDDVPDSEDFDDEQEHGCYERNGFMPGPEEFD